MLGFEWLIIIIIIDGGGDCFVCVQIFLQSTLVVYCPQKKKNLAIGGVTVWGRAGGAML